MTETWKPVVGYEGLYEVSDKGRVRSLPKEWVCGLGATFKHDGKLLIPTKSPEGYPQLRLRKNKTPYTVRIHRLVAEAFIPNPNNYKCVNHIDSDRANNHVENLEWVSHSGNRVHALLFGYAKKGDESPSAKLTDLEVMLIKDYPSPIKQRDLAKLYSVSESVISQIRNGKYKRANRIHEESQH